MPVRRRVARSLPLTEYPFRVNELGQSLHVRLQLGLALGRSKRHKDGWRSSWNGAHNGLCHKLCLPWRLSKRKCEGNGMMEYARRDNLNPHQVFVDTLMRSANMYQEWEISQDGSLIAGRQLQMDTVHYLMIRNK
ncbi:Cysteine-rich hydrophobic domain-containing protein 2 [Channa argus]|uniref:Cysteine-rich hydrophobic domain-containing protein 2 n=1 Tax=Channa argus TaxID=215402 RepID=A0A6G1PMG0_CHAAH|nr:Cysteine-rich hydrophobic domain-containing protein 2 [Channa argus]